MPYDVVIAGGGPAGLSAALTLGRSRRRVLLCDAGPRRNAAATQIHNFVTRDGTPPAEFRRVAREQLAAYSNVELSDAPILRVTGSKGAFELQTGAAELGARRLLLSTGMIDELYPIEGFAELWGHGVYQCPYCHGWEVKERPWGYLLREASMHHFAVMLRSWSEQVTVYTQGAMELGPEQRAELERHGVALETRRIARLVRTGDALAGVELSDGRVVPCEALYAHPPQRQVKLVTDLGLELDAEGYVRVDPMSRETSRPGIYAAGDLCSRAQSAVFAAAAGAHAAGMINHELSRELGSGPSTRRA